jgi:hypothetical protein
VISVKDVGIHPARTIRQITGFEDRVSMVFILGRMTHILGFLVILGELLIIFEYSGHKE